jgi:hypothetical protein
MGNRACPLCFAKVPRSLVLTSTEDLACPSCHTPLELSRSSRVLSAVVGLCAGFLAVHFVLDVSTTARWVLPMVGALLAYGFASALLLVFVSDLVVQPKPPAGHSPHSHR